MGAGWTRRPARHHSDASGSATLSLLIWFLAGIGPLRDTKRSCALVSSHGGCLQGYKVEGPPIFSFGLDVSET